MRCLPGLLPRHLPALPQRASIPSRPIDSIMAVTASIFFFVESRRVKVRSGRRILEGNSQGSPPLHRDRES
ncbi:MAG: hypothetical protein MZV64_35600 [Ignavibacteriales bacterium]|nr:hypothetical protein [Ignavibacteriales bacterium]